MPEKVMTDPEGGEEATLFPKTAGEKLRDARESQGLTLADVAARTRIPMRHLEAIEISDYTGLPSPTYSVGFAKAYARAVGADEVAIGREVRGQADVAPRPTEYIPYEIADPSRLPPRGLTTVVSVVAVLLLMGVGIWYGTSWFRGDGSSAAPAPVASPVTSPVATAPVPAATAPAVSTGAQVTLTATDTVWLRLYDSAGKTLFQGELKPGDHVDVPADADRPMVNVGRPDQLKVTVNGSIVAPLGTGERAIKDVGVSAEALLARGQEAPGTAGLTASPPLPGAVARAAPARTPTRTPADRIQTDPAQSTAVGRDRADQDRNTSADAPTPGAPPQGDLPQR